MISVVIPTYNEAESIADCIKAVKNQTLPRKEFEIIVSDSSSSDQTVKIAEGFADRVVVCKKHSAGFGRNFGAKEAKGEILAFVDADTVPNRQWLEGIKEAMQDPNCVVATGPFRSLEKPTIFEIIFLWLWGTQSRLSVFFGRPIVPGFNFAARKKAFDSVGGFSEEDIVCEDLELSQRLGKIGKARYGKKISVLTSVRNLRETGMLEYAKHGLLYSFFGKKYRWSDHRKDF